MALFTRNEPQVPATVPTRIPIEAARKPMKPVPVRHYDAAQFTRLTEDWYSSSLGIHDAIRNATETLRNRARDLERNDDFVRRFLSLMESNVIGPRGIRMKGRIRDANGDLDKAANQKVEQGWGSWGKPGICTMDGRQSLVDLKRMSLRRMLIDGEFFARKIMGAPNKYGFALQPIAPERIDILHNVDPGNGQNRIIMGVELNSFNRPVAYHVVNEVTEYNSRRVRIPADEMVHMFIMERPDQVRGITWIASGMMRKRMLDAFEHATVVGARIAASKMGFFITDSEFKGEGKDNTGYTLQTVAPGHFEALPADMKFEAFDPAYPPANFREFEGEIKRGLASGFGVNYTALANDLQGASYSGIRSGELSDRDFYRMFQNLIIEHFIEQFVPDWLLMSLTTQAIPLPLAKLEKFSAFAWRPRGWDWVDPLNAEKANTEALTNKTTSRTRICAAKGIEFEDVVEELAAEEELAKAHNISLETLDKPKEEVIEDGQSTETVD